MGPRPVYGGHAGKVSTIALTLPTRLRLVRRKLTMTEAIPDNFEDLADSRRQWIEQILRPWCRKATHKQLQQADLEWQDFAGRVDAHATMWTWAWERFPALVHDDLPGVNETHAVVITLRNGRTARGFPDGRRSIKGKLVLVGTGEHGLGEHGPFSIDEIVDAHRT